MIGKGTTTETAHMATCSCPQGTDFEAQLARRHSTCAAVERGLLRRESFVAR